MKSLTNRLVALMLLIAIILPAGSAYAYPEIAGEQKEVMEINLPSSPVTETTTSLSIMEAYTEAAEDKEDQALTYVVISGDTLYKISRDFGLSPSVLQAFNGITNPGALKVGQQINIPSVPADVPLLEGKEPVIKKVLSTTLTAYTSGKESTGKTPSHPAYGITFSGVKAEEGRTVAVDPNIIPLGSTVYIEGIGIRKAEDTGSAIKGAKIDVYMNDLDEAQHFGVKRNVKVFVLSNA